MLYFMFKRAYPQLWAGAGSVVTPLYINLVCTVLLALMGVALLMATKGCKIDGEGFG